jgi:copper chaperone CopZ
LTSIEGVTVHEVAIGRAVVDYDVLQVDGERIYDAIRRSGYDVERDPAAR